MSGGSSGDISVSDGWKHNLCNGILTSQLLENLQAIQHALF